MPITDRPGDPDKHKATERQAQPQTYLDLAVHSLVDPAADALLPRSQAKVVADEVSFYAKGFAKTAPLFMKGELALGGTLLAYAADQAKVGDTAGHQITDAGLGITKALTMKGTFAMMEQRGLSPTLSGIGLGISSRTLETGLTRESYTNADGESSLLTGFNRTVKSALNPASLAIDAVSFGAADVVWGRMYMASRGAVRFNPVLGRSIAAGTMGVSAGAGGELNRQLEGGDKLDLGLIMGRGAAQGGLNVLAGGLAGMQVNRQMRLEVHDQPGAIGEARQTPFQTGKVVDDAQRLLRDGEFKPSRFIEGLTTKTMTGYIKSGTQEIPVLFRPDNGTESFASRQQAELVGYGLSSRMNTDTSPVTVARTVEVGGVKYSGFIQEMRGTNLFESMLPNTRMSPLMPLDRSLRSGFGSDQPMQTAFERAFVQRMIMGEWDNHSLNFSADRTASRTTVSNLDLGDALRPAANTAELVPSPGLRRSYEPLAHHLYGQMAGKPLSETTVQDVQNFLRTYDNSAGHAELKGLGMTDQQLAGVMGRTRWFEKNRYLPYESEPTTYHYFKQFVQYLRGRSSHQPTTIDRDRSF
jgi:hypothetical protein